MLVSFLLKKQRQKPLVTGFSDGVKFKDIEILNLESGKLIINLYGTAKKKAKKIISSSVSLSDEDGFVIAVVTFLVKN